MMPLRAFPVCRFIPPTVLWLTAAFLSGCAVTEEKAAVQRDDRVSFAADATLAPQAAAWGGAASIPPGSATGYIAAALHDQNTAGFWSVQGRVINALGAPVNVGYHPDSVTVWGKDTFAVAVEGAGKIQFWNVAGNAPTKVAEITTPFPTRDLVAADLDGDDRLDLILAPYAGKRIAILWGEGGYSFSAPQFLDAAPTPWHPRAVDWNMDGRTDLVWTDWDEGSARLYLNQGKRQFEFVMLHPADSLKPRQLGVGDVDQDGRPDAVMVLEVGKAARILYNRGPQGAVEPELVPAPSWGYVSAAVMRDGTLVLGEELRIILARKVSRQWVFRQLPAGSLPSPLSLADLDQDGYEDLLVFNSAKGGVTVHFGPLWEKAEPTVFASRKEVKP